MLGKNIVDNVEKLYSEAWAGNFTSHFHTYYGRYEVIILSDGLKRPFITYFLSIEKEILDNSRKNCIKSPFM